MNAATNLPRIRYHGLSHSFQSRRLLDQINLSIGGGEAILLSGENGVGKTTLLKILAGLTPPDRCQVALDERPFKAWRACRPALTRRVMYLHQQPYMFDGDVTRNLGLALPRNTPKVARRTRIAQALAWAQLDGIAHNHAKTLSGGEKQRVSLARAFLAQTEVILLDEPTANLDAQSQSNCVELLRRLQQAQVSLLIASHHIQLFAPLADRHLRLSEGKLGSEL